MQTLQTLRRDPVATLALIHYATGSSLVLLFAVLVPRYMQAILKVSPDKAVTIFAPVGVGAILGLRALPLIAARLGKNRTVIIGLCGLALCADRARPRWSRSRISSSTRSSSIRSASSAPAASRSSCC